MQAFKTPLNPPKNALIVPNHPLLPQKSSNLARKVLSIKIDTIPRIGVLGVIIVINVFVRQSLDVLHLSKPPILDIAQPGQNPKIRES